MPKRKKLIVTMKSPPKMKKDRVNNTTGLLIEASSIIFLNLKHAKLFCNVNLDFNLI